MEPAIETRVDPDDLGRPTAGRDGSGGNGGLYFIVGALVVVVAVSFVMITGHHPFGGPHQVDVHIDTPHMPGHCS